MIDAVSFLIVILLSVGLSHILLPNDYRNRLFWITVPGALLLFIVHPLALVFALVCYALSTTIFLFGRAAKSPRFKARLPYAILLLLFVPDVSRLAIEQPVLWLGSAFFIIRQMMTVTQGLKTSVSLAQFFPGLLMATFNHAALPSGPVYNGLNTWDKLKKNDPPSYGEGCYRLFEGFVYLFAVAGLLSLVTRAIGILQLSYLQSGETSAHVLLHYVAEPLASFGFLFATFYGYSRMAEGSALLFGFEVPQNFNKPHLATDLGDFWKRWHRSMANFVMQYIYLPLLVTTKKSKEALVLAFVFMGLWHNISLAFLVWGLGHGVGLAYLLPWARNHNVSPIVIRVASLVYVVILSGIAHGVWTK